MDLITKANLNKKKGNGYYSNLNGNLRYLLTGAIRIAEYNLIHTGKAIVYWPDYRLVGTPQEIYDLLVSNGIETVDIGDLFEMTFGCLGDFPRKNVILSPQLISDNSFHPLDEYDQQYLTLVAHNDIKGVRDLCQAQHQYNQEFYREQSRIPFGRAVSIIPEARPNKFFPQGGVGYQEAEQFARENYLMDDDDLYT